MNITITNPNGVKLKTANKYCPEDIDVFPILQEKTTTLNNVDVTADEGYTGLSTVHVALPEEGAKLNVEYSLTAPTNTSKIWVKCDTEPIYFSVSSNAENQLLQYVDLPISLPIKVKVCPVTAVGSKIYIFGSLDDYENNICVVDLSDNTVTTITKAFGYSMKDSKAVTVGDKIYIFCAPAAKILMYDPQTDTLTEKLDWACGASVYMGCAVYNDCIYIAGKDSAYKAGKGDMYLYCYNTISNSVTSMGWISGQNYRYASVAVYGDHLYVVGGQRQSSSYDTTKVIMKYDFEAKTWTSLNDALPNLRYQLKNLLVGSKLYLFGAMYYPQEVYCFDFETEMCELIGQQFPNYNDYENVWYANAFYRVGGSTTESVQKTVSKFSVDFELAAGKVMFYISGSGKPLKVLSGQKDIEVKVKNVFIGNASGRAELLDAYYHNGTAWVNINTGATLS